MAAPLWYTTNSNLGVIQENSFYQFALDARDSNGDTIVYSIVSGRLPDGIELGTNGSLFGQPKKIVKGVPFEVSQDVTDRFTVRAKSSDNIVTDKTFSLTVTGQDIPVFTTAGNLGSWIDYQYINKQVIVTDSDSNDTITFEFLRGDLPPGVKLTTDGYVRGFIEPALVQGAAADGNFDQAPYDTVLYDSGAGIASYSRNYSFVTRVTDGKAYVVKEFSFFVYGGFDLASDVTDVTTDLSGTITADNSSAYSPVIRHSVSDLGSHLHDNNFNFKIDGVDYNDDEIAYSISSGALPPGVVIDTNTGWIFGSLPFVNKPQETYTFTVKVQKVTDPENQYFATKEFTLNVVSNKNLSITWVTPSDLGKINAGDISTINIEAISANGTALYYEILSGSTSKLPQGLQLLSTGLLQGQTSFKGFMLDGGSTGLDVTKTTIDNKCTFTVKAKDSTGTLFNTKTFTLLVDNFYNTPFENVYIELLPKAGDRTVWEQMVYNNQDIPDSYLYRPTDIYFGKQRQARMLFLSGMTASTLSSYAKAVYQNHYSIDLRFGNFKSAKAQNKQGNYIYDIVYVEIDDVNDPVAINGVPQIANTYIQYNSINNPISVDEGAHIENGSITVDNQNVTKLFPARLSTMQSRVQDVIGLSDSRTLPSWMTSVQADGTVLGYTPACVIAYLQPGTGNKVLYYLNSNKGIELNKIEFTVDRYTIDGYFSKNYNTVTPTNRNSGELLPTSEYLPYDRIIDVNGVKIVGSPALGGASANTDEFLKKVAQVYVILTNSGYDGINTQLQDNMILALNGDTGTFHAGYPTAQRIGYHSPGAYNPSIVDDDAINNYTGLQTFLNTYLTNDYIWELPNGSTDAIDSVSEVLEHILHTLHIAGVRGTTNSDAYTDLNVQSTSSAFYIAMKEAVDNGIFDITYYSITLDGNETSEQRTLLGKEYSYLLTFGMWEYISVYISGGSLAPEWADSCRTQSGIQLNNPLGFKLYNDYFAKMIAKPTTTQLNTMFINGNQGTSGYVPSPTPGWLTRPQTTYDRYNDKEYTGDGSTTAFTLDSIPIDTRSVYVTINGIAQARTSFSISSNTVTFVTAPTNATTIVLDDTSYQSSTEETTYDGNTTQFFAYSDKPRTDLNSGNEYVKFPRNVITDLP